MKSTSSNVTVAAPVYRAEAMTPSRAPRPAVAAAAFLVALGVAVGLTGTGPPSVANVRPADDGQVTATTGQTTWDLESLLSARHHQMDAGWFIRLGVDPVTTLRRTSLSWAH